MSVMLFVQLALFAGGLLLLVSGLPLRHRGGDRRCPKCRYDLSKTADQRCSECGYAWRSKEELLQRPRRPGRLVAGIIALVLALWLTLFSGSHWTHYLPQPVLSALLHVVVPHQPVQPGAALPSPDPTLYRSADRWDRLVWQKQAARAIEHFLHLVEQSDGTVDAAHALMPAVFEANAIHQEYLGSRAVDAFALRAVKQRARQRAAEIDARFSLPLGTWAASELQFFAGDIHKQHNWLAPPLEVLGPLSRSDDVAVRRHALRRMANVSSRQASELIESLCNDPDETLAAEAKRTLIWRRDMHAWE